ncbi:MAG: ATP synthase subunit I [Gammaproteobacteria bacterium]|nr:ATP synthase subunit I [Gammaproteobacteria bacterium]
MLTFLAAVVFALTRGAADFLAATYGGAIAILLTAYLGFGVLRARGLGSLYINALTRYGLAILGLGLGIAALKLAPLALVATFAVAQLGLLANTQRA